MKRYKGILRIVSAALVFFVFVPACVSCGKKVYHTDEEIRAELEILLPLSAELNEIYFGCGLPFKNNEDELNEYFSSVDYDIKNLNYAQVDPECGYEFEEDIKKATRDVFSEEYSDFLIGRAFTGLSDILPNENGEEITENAVYARFIEEDGILTQRLGLEEEALELGREYDLERMEIVKQKQEYVLVDIPTELNGREAVVRLKMILTEDGWRLDSPTY